MKPISSIQHLEALTKRLETPSHIMVVDDEESCRKILSDVIVEQGCVPISCASVEEALGLLPHHTIDLIFLDIMFPGKDGIDFLNQVRREATKIPIVIVSGYMDESTLKLLSRIFPVVSWILKPFDTQAVREAIQMFRIKRRPHASE